MMILDRQPLGVGERNDPFAFETLHLAAKYLDRVRASLGFAPGKRHAGRPARESVSMVRVIESMCGRSRCARKIRVTAVSAPDAAARDTDP